MAQAAATRVRPRASGASGIRWDRVGRLGLLGVLFVILILYISPVVHWIEQSRTASHQRAEVQSLQAQHDTLQARLHELRSPGAVEREARRLGMVAPGEKPYVVQGIAGDR